MTKIIPKWLIPLTAALLFTPAGLQGRSRHHVPGSMMPVQDEETIRKTFSVSGHKLLEIDNIHGFIEVTGGSGDQVQLVVSKTIRAESQEKAEAAKKKSRSTSPTNPTCSSFM